MSESTNLIFTAIELSKLLGDAKPGANTASLVTSLKQTCLTADASVAASALDVLTRLVECGTLDVGQGLSTLISLVSSSKEPIPALVPAIGRLLLLDATRPEWQCPFNVSDRPHPLVTILKHSWNTWNGVVGFVLNVLSGFTEISLEQDRRMAVVRPVISAVLLDPSSPLSAKTQLVQLLVIHRQDAVLFELLPWQQIDINWCILIREALSEYLTRRPSDCLSCVEALTPALAAAIAYLTTQGHDPTAWIELLQPCLHLSSASVDVVLFILARVIPHCSTIYLPPISQLCSAIMSTQVCNVYAASAVAAAMLNWAICPSPLTAGFTKCCQEILEKLPSLPTKTSSSQLLKNNLFIKLVNSCSEVHLCLHMALLIKHWENKLGLLEWLRIASAELKSSDSLKNLQPLLLAVVLHSQDSQVSGLVLKLLTEAVRAETSFAFSVLCSALFKLSQEAEPKLQLQYLQLIPEVGAYKENVPLVLATIESLDGGDAAVMTPIRMKLLLALWSHQPRTFPYLNRLLQISPVAMQNSWQLQVARAATLLEICRRSPHNHGKEVVGLLSDVLNASCGQDGAAASSLALDAITELCKAHVIDVQGTWAALEPKMRKEDRPRVAASVCRLLAEASESQSEDTRAIAIARLWALVSADCASSDALVALGRFPLDAFTLTSFPAPFRQELTIPRELVVKDVQQSPEQVLSYVPGECWIQLLEKIDSGLVAAAEEMISGLLRGELTGLPRGIYALPEGSPEPRSYSPLHPSSILRALTDCLQRISRQGWASSRLCESAVRLLSHDYSRPLPPLDWSFLQPVIADKICRRHAVKLCAQQGPKSPSARKIVQDFIRVIDVDDKEDAAEVFSVLVGLSQCVATAELTPLVSDVLRTALVDTQLFADAMNAVRRTIGLANVSESSRTALVKVVKVLLSDIPSDLAGENVLWECVAEFPPSVVERLTNPSHWPEVTSRRMKQALRVRSAAALAPMAAGCPLDGFSELIDTACSSGQDLVAVLEAVLTVLRKAAAPEKFPNWFRQLMARLLAATSSTNPVEGSLFLLELLVASSVILSGCDLLLAPQLRDDRDALLGMFPASLQSLFSCSNIEWSKVLPHVVEGLHRLSHWEHLPLAQSEALHQALVALRHHTYCTALSRWPRLFYRLRPDSSLHTT